jgi:hypothetical protein
METISGKIAINDNDDVVVELADGNKIPINNTSLGNKSYNIGEEVQGVIVDEKLNVCREYDHSRKGKLFGFISNDEMNDDWITITVMTDFRPNLVSQGGIQRYQTEYGVGEQITVRRSLINNY